MIKDENKKGLKVVKKPKKVAPLEDLKGVVLTDHLKQLFNEWQ
jgi:hypothetical protein